MRVYRNIFFSCLTHPTPFRHIYFVCLKLRQMPSLSEVWHAWENLGLSHSPQSVEAPLDNGNECSRNEIGFSLLALSGFKFHPGNSILLLSTKLKTRYWYEKREKKNEEGLHVAMVPPSHWSSTPFPQRGEGLGDLGNHLTFRITDWGSVITESPKGEVAKCRILIQSEHSAWLDCWLQFILFNQLMMYITILCN